MSARRPWWKRLLCRLGLHGPSDAIGMHRYYCPECEREWEDSP